METLGIKCEGNSMYPEIKDGEIVCIEKIDNFDTLTEGSIVLFQRFSKLILHRIIKIDRGYCFVKGDNESEVDVVKKSNILGVKVDSNIENGISASFNIILDEKYFFDVTINKGILETIEYKG